jgi:Tfp pilus assembly protein PilF
MQPEPRNFSDLFQMGLIAAQAKDLAAAATLFGRAIELEPGHAAAHGNLGTVLTELKRWREALASFDQAIALKSDYLVAHANRGNVLQELKRPDDALASYDRALAINPNFAEAYCNRGNVLKTLELPDAALTSFNQAIALNPGLAEAYANRGIVQRQLKQLDAALASYDQAIAIKGDYAEAYCNRGVVLQELRRTDMALASFDQAIAHKADFAEAYFNRSMALLSCGDFDRGWTDYEWRWSNDNGSNIPDRRFFPQPLWLGIESIAGKRILLHGEQGLGDTLQFCRYAKSVANLGAYVVLEVQKPLARVLAKLDGVSQLLSRGDALPEFDYHCPLLSLPLAFKTTLETIPVRNRYLWAEACKIIHWQHRLGEKTRPRVGLVWNGKHRTDNDRSILLADLVQCLPADFQYVSLQKEVREPDSLTLQANPAILDFRDEAVDFSDTAALCECMDVVISVDTSVAHLSAALGRKTWILLPYVADWRWLIDRDTSPWYESVTLYRQAIMHDWRGVFEMVAADLSAKFGA